MPYKQQNQRSLHPAKTSPQFTVLTFYLHAAGRASPAPSRRSISALPATALLYDSASSARRADPEPIRRYTHRGRGGTPVSMPKACDPSSRGVERPIRGSQDRTRRRVVCLLSAGLLLLLNSPLPLQAGGVRRCERMCITPTTALLVMRITL